MRYETKNHIQLETYNGITIISGHHFSEKEQATIAEFVDLFVDYVENKQKINGALNELKKDRF